MIFYKRTTPHLIVLVALLGSVVLALSIGFTTPAHADASATDPRWYQDDLTGNQYNGVPIVSGDECTYLVWKFDTANPSWSINTTPTGDNALAGNAAQYFDYYDSGRLYNGLARRARSNPQLISDAAFATNSQAPQAGDLLVFQELNNPNNWTQGLYLGVNYNTPGYPQGLSNSPGHVAIVTGMHDGNVYFAEQNAGSAHDFGSTTISWTNNGWHIAVPWFLGYTNRVVRGWIHYPANTGITELHLLAVSNGTIYHAIRHSNGSWQAFGNVDQVAGNPGYVTSVAAAQINGELQVLAVSNGIVYHTIRHSDGTWQAFGNVDQVAGNPGSVDEIAAAGINGDLHVVVDVGGQIYHTIRHSNGSWDPFVNIDTVIAVPGYVQSVAIANVNGELQVVVAVGYQVATQLYHTIRHSNGSWQAFGNVDQVAGNPGAVGDITAGGIGGDLHVVVEGVDGQIYHAIRYSSGSWQAFGNVDQVAGNPGSVDTAAAASIDGELQLVVAVNDQLYHAIRHSNGSWQAFGNVDAVAGDPGFVLDLAAA